MKTNLAVLCFSTNAPTELINNASNVKMIPLPCTLGEKTYITGEISLQDFIDECMNNKIFPKTSQPSPGDINKAILELKKDYETVFIITPKYDLTGVYNGCSLAIDMLEDKSGIILLDTYSMAMGECIIIEQILKMQNDYSADEIKGNVLTLINSFTTYAFPGSLKFLKMGGRISGTSAFVGEMINLKTAIKVTKGVEKGVVDLKGRGYKSIFKYIEKQIEATGATHACLTDLTCDAKVFEQVKKIIIDHGLELKLTLDPDIVLASHFGPQSFGLVLYKTNYNKSSDF